VKNVTLRGAGPDQTFLSFTGPAACLWTSVICVGDSSGVYSSSVPSSNIVNWTAGYTAGSSQITVSDASGIAVGMYITLDQLNDTFNPSTTYAPFITCADPWLATGVACDGGRDDNPATNRGILSRHKVMSKSGNTLTIAPSLQYSHYQPGKSPQVWWA